MDIDKLSMVYDDRMLMITKLLANVRITSQEILKSFNKYFEKRGYDITVDQWRILRWIYVLEDNSLLNICRVSQEDRGAVSRLITRLEKSGYVIRTKNEKEPRKQKIILTKKANDARDDLLVISRLDAEHMVDGISVENMDICISTLKKIIENANKPRSV